MANLKKASELFPKYRDIKINSIETNVCYMEEMEISHLPKNTIFVFIILKYANTLSFKVQAHIYGQDLGRTTIENIAESRF